MPSTPIPTFAALVRGAEPRWAGILALATVFALLAAGAAGLFYVQYYRWNFNAEGRHYDDRTHVVYDEGAGCIYGGCFALFAIPATALAFVGFRRRRNARRFAA